MTFLDWSDRENVFDMLVEYVSDAKTEAHGEDRRTVKASDILPRLK
jgi:hypothetical protein